MMAYLVAQGAAIVLLIDWGIATAMGDKTTFRSICQAAGWWKDGPGFEEVHASSAGPGGAAADGGGGVRGGTEK